MIKKKKKSLIESTLLSRNTRGRRTLEDTRGHPCRLLRCREKHLHKKLSALETLLLPAHFHRDNQVVYPWLLCYCVCATLTLKAHIKVDAWQMQGSQGSVFLTLFGRRTILLLVHNCGKTNTKKPCLGSAHDKEVLSGWISESNRPGD